MKESKGFITKKMLEENQNIFADSDKFDDWVKFMESTEPEFYSWMQKTTGVIISDIAQHTRITMQDGHRLAHYLIAAFTFGYMINYNLNKEKIESIINGGNTDKQFKKWLIGKMPAKWYKYSLKGLNKGSSSYKAKKNFLEEKKKKDKDIEKEIAKGEFIRVREQVKDFSDNEELITDDDLKILGENGEQS